MDQINLMNLINKLITVNYKNRTYLKVISLLFLICTAGSIFAQNKDSILPKINNFAAVVTVQTKGISTIPNLTLGKPAMIYDLKIGRKLTFEPQFRFALNGKPWAMVFWWRYYGAIGKKYKAIFSTNYSFSYKSIVDTSSTNPIETIRATRYLAGTILSNYQLNKYIGIDIYLFYTYGIEKFITRNTYMVSFRPSFSNIPIFKNVVARVIPEVYYLKMDKKDGMFLNASFSISKKGFPISVSGLINKRMNSNIPSDYDLLWNLGLVYSFNKKYSEVHHVL